MKIKRKTLIWVGLGIAALYLYNRSQAAAGTMPGQTFLPPYSGGGSPTGTPVITPGAFSNQTPA